MWHLDANMALRVQNENGIGDWWRVQFERGFRSAFLASLYGGPPERLGLGDVVSAFVWGLGVPLLAGAAAGGVLVASSTFAPALPAPNYVNIIFAVFLMLYVIRGLLGVLSRGIFRPTSWLNSFGEVFSAFPRLIGILKFVFGANPPAPRD